MTEASLSLISRICQAIMLREGNFESSPNASPDLRRSWETHKMGRLAAIPVEAPKRLFTEAKELFDRCACSLELGCPCGALWVSGGWLWQPCLGLTFNEPGDFYAPRETISEPFWGGAALQLGVRKRRWPVVGN